MINPQKYYEEKINDMNEKLKVVEKKSSMLSYGRLIIAIAIIALAYYFYTTNNIKIGGIVLGILVVIFIAVAIVHNNIINKKKKMLAILEYNQRGIKRINGNWKEFQDCGEEFINLKHNFSSDLDIFGKNSLFQWINTTKSAFGREKLASILRISKLPDNVEVINNQEALKELSEKREFCEKIYINSDYSKDIKESSKNLLMWMESDEKTTFTHKYISYLFISITLIFIYLTLSGRLPVNYLILDLFINYLVVKLITRNLNDTIDIILKSKKSIIQYGDILNIIENEKFKSKKLKNLKSKLVSDNEKCNDEMGKLRNIINWLGDSRGNAYYLLLNVFMLSDIFVLYNLEMWRIKNGKKVREWLEVLGEFEAYSSLSNLVFENPNWSYPEVTADESLQCIQVAHPLLGEKGKANDFTLQGEKKVALITGSNMSGKSTFLRTIGFNMVLAYIGLPVKAKKFSCGIYSIYTCMRTQDNLEENISSFYAEILRIKLVIEAAKNGETVFFLLDEIFKGTNSKDRHIGAKVLIEQLVKENGKGLVSTHDFELCDLENVHKWLTNYNFQEYYLDNKIKFDYKLRSGRSTTQNAKYLMKMAGIDIVEN